METAAHDQSSADLVVVNGLYIVRNPTKLACLDALVSLTR